MRKPKAENVWLLLFVLSPLAVLTLLCVLIAANLNQRAERAGQQPPAQTNQPPSQQDAP